VHITQNRRRPGPRAGEQTRFDPKAHRRDAGEQTEARRRKQPDHEQDTGDPAEAKRFGPKAGHRAGEPEEAKQREQAKAKPPKITAQRRQRSQPCPRASEQARIECFG